MANTYTQLHIHCVFAVKYRDALINYKWEKRLYQYITGIVQNHGHKMLCINGMPDHVHIFFGFRPDQSLSNLMQLVKGESSEWINKEKLSSSQFRWQEGYGAFSYKKSDISFVCGYIENQKTHHQVKTFAEEYRELLEDFGIDYDNKYVFKSPE